MDKAFRSLLITSAGEKEGKTSTAANLAYTLAQAGKSVIIVDADLRKPMLGNLVSSHRESPGVTGLLSNLFGTSVEEGSLNNFGISDLVSLLSLQKKTGLMHLSDGKEEVGLDFFHGKLVDIRWLTRPAEKSLVNLLVNSRLLTKEDAAEAVSRQKDTGQNLSFILTNMGILKKDDLKGPLTLHIVENIRIALQMKGGNFYFKELTESEIHPSFDLLDIQQIYKDAVRGEEKLPYLQKEINSAILNVTDNLFLIPSGSLPPNPSELLGSERMSFLLSYLTKKFDVMIVDTPPILPASDALLLAPQIDGVVFVVKAGMLRREMVKKAVEQLQLAKANILGVVLNRIDIKREGYYRYYNKYYSGYYGDSKRHRKEEKSDDHSKDEDSASEDKKLVFMSNHISGDKTAVKNNDSDDEQDILNIK